MGLLRLKFPFILPTATKGISTNSGRCHTDRKSGKQPPHFCLWLLSPKSSFFPHTIQHVCECLTGLERNRVYGAVGRGRGEGGGELWNSVKGQNGNIFTRSSSLLYFDIWDPLRGQIEAIQTVSKREEESSPLFIPHQLRMQGQETGFAQCSVAIDWPQLFNWHSLQQM